MFLLVRNDEASDKKEHSFIDTGERLCPNEVLHTGTVNNWNIELGKGTIKGENQGEYVVSHVDLISKVFTYRALLPGDKVEFYSRPCGGPLNRAIRVTGPDREPLWYKGPRPSVEKNLNFSITAKQVNSTQITPPNSENLPANERLKRWAGPKRKLSFDDNSLIQGKIVSWDHDLGQGMVRPSPSAWSSPGLATSDSLMCNGSDVQVSGSYLMLNPDLEVEFQIAKTWKGESYAVNVTAPNRKPISAPIPEEEFMAIQELIDPLMIPPDFSGVPDREAVHMFQRHTKAPTSILHEFCQKMKQDMQMVEIVKEKVGSQEFVFYCILDDVMVSIGAASKKRNARANASISALHHLYVTMTPQEFMPIFFKIVTGNRQTVGNPRKRRKFNKPMHEQVNPAGAPALLKQPPYFNRQVVQRQMNTQAALPVVGLENSSQINGLMGGMNGINPLMSKLAGAAYGGHAQNHQQALLMNYLQQAAARANVQNQHMFQADPNLAQQYLATSHLQQHGQIFQDASGQLYAQAAYGVPQPDPTANLINNGFLRKVNDTLHALYPVEEHGHQKKSNPQALGMSQINLANYNQGTDIYSLLNHR